MQAPFTEISISLPHIRLNGWEYGDKSRPLLLALHGWLDNAQSFAPLALKLAEDYRLLAIDWPGHGLSDHRPGGYPLHWIDYLYDLHQLLLHLQTRDKRPQAIIAHSLGGIVASAYLSAQPQSCDALVLIEALVPLSEEQGEVQARLARSFAAHSRAQTAEQAVIKTYPSLDVVVAARHKLTGLDKGACRLLLERNFECNDGQWRARTDYRLKLDSPLRLTRAHAEAFVRDCELPTLLLIGDKGFTHSSKELLSARSLFRHLNVQMLSGDHHLHMTHASEVAQAIREFLQNPVQ